jgi:hypothetical protein
LTRFYYPFTKTFPEVVGAMPPSALRVDVSAGPDAYWGALGEWWARGEDFAIVEHDVVIRPDVVEAFDACPEPWCVFGYTPICHEACLEAWANMFGCTRFRAELMAELPDAVSSIPAERRDWHNLCDELAGNKIAGVDQPTMRPGSLRAAGYTHHWHRPPVRHISWERHP